MNLTTFEQAKFNSLTKDDVCYMCNKKFGMNKFNKVDKVRDHDHFTGEYRGAAHYKCNLQNKVHNYLPIVVHNGSGYDIHHLIRHLTRMTNNIANPENNKRVECKLIPISTEKFISFSTCFDAPKDSVLARANNKTIEVRFIDSFRFTLMSLDKLVKFSGNNLPIMKKNFPNADDFKLLTMKGIFFYEWLDSPDKLNYTEFPSIEKFRSSLNGDISYEEYLRGKIIWKHFNMKTIKDYHDLYLKTDVLLLADVFENFRTLCLDNYGLDPAHYYTAANIAWDALLKKSNIELDCISDENMYMFFEQAIRGGISQVGSQRYAKKVEEKNHLMYIDANNLYGWAMIHKLPYAKFEYMSREELDDLINKDIIKNYENEKNDIGYTIKVTLRVPKDKHDYFSEFPLAPEKMKPKRKDLNTWQQEFYKHDESEVSKLCCTLYDKVDYIVAIENLRFYLEEGCELVEIKEGVKYLQKAWMKNYILGNAELRKKAKAAGDDFGVEFFKLMNNSVFGKTMEDARKYQNMKIINWQDEESFLRSTSTDSFKTFTTIDKELIIVSHHKTKVKLNKPIYCGAKVLDLSKLHMYNFFYRCLKKKFNERVKLLYMDTDSYFLLFETNDIIKEFSKQEIEEWFDTADYPNTHPWYTEKNKGVLGKFKDETKGYKILEFCGLASKMYGFKRERYPDEDREKIKEYNFNKKMIDDYQMKLGGSDIYEWLEENPPIAKQNEINQQSSITSIKCKGSVKNTVKTFNLEMMKNVLITGESSAPAKQFRITSKKHELYTIEEMKKNFRLFDDKRFILDEPNELNMQKVFSRPIGHYRNLEN